MKELNKPRFGFIPTKKKTVKKQQAEPLTAEQYAEECHKIFQSLLYRGFTSEQSFQLLLITLNKN